MKIQCSNCRRRKVTGHFRTIIQNRKVVTLCPECYSGESMRRPLTEYERMKLSWYRSEKKWIENIRDRKTMRDKNGQKVVVSQGQVMPQQPRKYWPKPKQI